VLDRRPFRTFIWMGATPSIAPSLMSRCRGKPMASHAAMKAAAPGDRPRGSLTEIGPSVPRAPPGAPVQRSMRRNAGSTSSCDQPRAPACAQRS